MFNQYCLKFFSASYNNSNDKNRIQIIVLKFCVDCKWFWGFVVHLWAFVYTQKKTVKISNRLYYLKPIFLIQSRIINNDLVSYLCSFSLLLQWVTSIRIKHTENQTHTSAESRVTTHSKNTVKVNVLQPTYFRCFQIMI